MAVANVVAKFEADISDVQTKMAALKRSFADAGDSAQSLSTRFQTVGAEMSRVGKGMTIGVSLPLAAVGAAAVKASVDFESSMSKIVGLVGIASSEVDQMKESVLGLASETAKSPVELADALFVVTSAGLRGSDALQALESSARAGTAGLGETADIARSVAGALSAYGSDVLSAADATDQIVATARAGNFETSQFAGAIGRVLPFAQQAGATFADMGGAVALLTRTNGDAAQSVTQMAALFRAFVVPSEQARKGLAKVGLSAEQLRDSIAKKGLPQTLQMLDKALGGNREELGRILGSSEAASAAFQILNADAQTISDTFGVVADSAGMTQEAFDAAADTAGFKMQQAMVSLQATLISLGDIIVPLVTDVAKFAKTLLDGFTALPGPVKTLTVAFAGVVAALGPILWIGGKVVTLFATMSGAFLAAKLKIMSAVTAIGASFTGLGTRITTAMIAARTQMGALAGAARVTGVAIAGAFRTAGVAVKGFLTSLGPVGFAIIGVSVAYEVLAGRNADAEARVEALTEALGRQGAEAQKAAAEIVAGALLANEWGRFLWIENNVQDFERLAEIAGLSMSEIVSAAIAGGDELNRVISAFTAAGEQGLIDPLRAAEAISLVQQEAANYVDATKAKEIANQALGISADVASKAAREQSATYRGLAAEKRAADKAMTDSQKALDDALNSGVAAVEALENAFKEMNAVISNEASRDAAIQGIKKLNETLEANGKSIKGTSDAALDNRAAIRDAAQQWIDYAAAAKDPEEAQKRLAKGQDEIRASLKKAGIKPEDSDIFKTLKAQAQQSGETVDEFAAQREKAATYGTDVGRNFIDGILRELAARRDQVAAAAAAATSALTTGGNAGIDASSPSRDAMKVAGNFVDGLVVGLRAKKPKISEAARDFMRTFMESFAPRDMGTAESAIAGAVDVATQALKDARSELRDANRAVVDAQRELNRVRKDGDASAKDIAKAEKQLAQARKQAAKATQAVKTAEWVQNNKKALTALQAIGRQYDYIKGKMESTKEAFSSLSRLLETPLGTASDLSQMFEFGTDPRTLARNFTTLADSIRSAYEVLTDPKIVGATAARANATARDMAIAELQSYVSRIIALQSEYEANAEQMRKNETQWRIDETALKSNLDAATRAYEDATRELERIVNERNGFITKISDGFRSFVNNLSGLTKDSVSVVTEQVRDLGNGIRTIVRTTRQETQGGAAGIAASLRSRLDEVREFSRNVQTLMRRGLDPALVRDFIESGVSGAGSTVAALAAATDDELRSINATQAELLTYAQEFASGVGDAYYSSAIASQQAIVRDAQAAVDAAQKALKDATDEYDAERARLEAEQTRIETDINSLVTQIEALVTNLMTTLVPATEAAAQASINSMIAQFQKDFPKLSKELNRLMDTLAKSMERTVQIAVQPSVGTPGASTRMATVRGATVPVPALAGATAAASNVTYQITVNAGVGDPREIGRVTVEAITAYERTSGPVYARA